MNDNSRVYKCHDYPMKRNVQYYKIQKQMLLQCSNWEALRNVIVVLEQNKQSL
jgi:hypothetical protein